MGVVADGSISFMGTKTPWSQAVVVGISRRELGFEFEIERRNGIGGRGGILEERYVRR